MPEMRDRQSHSDPCRNTRGRSGRCERRCRTTGERVDPRQGNSTRDSSRAPTSWRWIALAAVLGSLPVLAILAMAIYQLFSQNRAVDPLRKRCNEYLPLVRIGAAASRQHLPTTAASTWGNCTLRGKCVLIEYDAVHQTVGLHEFHKPAHALVEVGLGLFGEVRRGSRDDRCH